MLTNGCAWGMKKVQAKQEIGVKAMAENFTQTSHTMWLLLK